METLYQSGQTQEDPLAGLHDEFLELAVHDLDAPLRKLVLLTERLGEKCKALQLPEDIDPYMERITHCANTMRSLIDDLHLLTSIRSQQSSFTDCNLDEIAEYVWQELQVDHPGEQIEMDIAPLPTVQGDKRLLAILFKNLVGNAFKFRSKENNPEISIKSFPVKAEERAALGLSSNNSFYRIEIADRGIGVREEDRERIFTPFVSLHGKSTPGNGMGLAICKKIAELHNGLLFAEANDDKGSIFILIIPQMTK